MGVIVSCNVKTLFNKSSLVTVMKTLNVLGVI